LTVELPRIISIVAECIPLNIELRKVLNPRPPQSVARFGSTFAVGDKVMLIENGGRPVLYGDHELDQVVLAYATTVHKAQGSEYPAVVIPVTTQHYPMLQRNLIYTGITRGRKLVVLVGQKKALAMAVRGSRAVRRWSKLGDWLAAGRV
jgi:exodeoxyribonuclease V alpha subunit